MSIRTNGRTANTQPIYRCARNGEPTDVPPHNIGIVADKLEEFAWVSFVESVSQSGVVEQAIALLDQRRDAETASQLKILRDMLDENQEQQQELDKTAKLVKNDTARARLAQQLDALADEETKVRERISLLEQHESVLVAAQAVLKKFSHLSRHNLDSMDFAAKRRMLFDCGVHVVVYPSQSNHRLVPAERCKVVVDVLSRATDTNNEVPRDREVLVICEHGVRSAQVVKFLRQRLGLTRAINVAGGTEEWERQGLPMERIP